ncbi:hypothetical protein M378DRAFT_179324 [Amanita muscaria Koide BX008]|uniref:Uncharacterized protein n=1 Tax=Amanita muscaria (strain Koide BX008) TaxID=946122 RepID=A0A0C2T9N2_AMAMK|nr:hypothetical protein M378DRAFT_179324 [Amanita muscaria Koide BX008]
MNAGAGGSISATSNQQLSQQVINSPQIGRSYISLNAAGATLEIAPSARRGSVGNMLKGNGQIQTFTFDPVIEQELQRQMDDFKKTVTIVLWFKARTEPLRIQHTIRSFPFFEMSTLSSIVHDLGLADESYLDTYIPESDQWMQHTIRTVRIVDSQQRLLYRMRKNLLEGINAEECTGLPAELELQKQILTSKRRSMVKMDGGLPTPTTPALSAAVTDTTNKNPRKRPATDNDDFDQGSGQPPKIHIQNGYYLTSPRDAIVPQTLASTSAPIVSSATAVGESSTTASGCVDTVSRTVPSSSTDYLYQNTIYYAHPSTSTNNTTTVLHTQHTPDTPHLVQSEENTATASYRHDLPIKRWPNDYSVAEVSAGFHDMDRLITQTPNLTQRVAFERVFCTRYVKSTVCRHRGVWKRASREMRDHFITMGNDERASWTDFVRTAEGRPTLKVGRNEVTLSPPSHETIEFPVRGSEAAIVGMNTGSDSLQGQSVSSHDDSSGGVEEPTMDSLQGAAASG